MDRTFWVQESRVQASRVNCLESDHSAVWSPSVQGPNIQLSRVQASSRLDSKRPGVQSASVQSPIIQNPSVQSYRVQETRVQGSRPCVQSLAFPLWHENIRKSYNFLMFSGGRERIHWEQIG